MLDHLSADKVQVQEFRGKKEKWEKETIEKRLGPVSYLVKIQGKSKQINVDHILAHQTKGTKNKQPEASDTSVNPSETPNIRTHAHRYPTCNKHFVI